MAADISGLNSHFAAQQAWAAGLLVIFFLLIAIGLRIVSWAASHSQADDGASESPARITIGWGRLSSLVGLDNRVSTSRTIALLWTVVVGYCLLALVLIATAKHSSAHPIPPGQIPDGFIAAALKPLAPAYVVLLGAPFAAAVGARAIVGHRVKTGQLQKSASTSLPNPLQVVTDDDGNLDLVDLQYTLFNLIAVTFVLTQFIPHPARGIPDVPAALAVLTGVSAAVYTSNKAATSNPATITDVLTPSVLPRQLATIVGQNLVVSPDSSDPAGDAAKTKVSLIPVQDQADSGTAADANRQMAHSVAVNATAAAPDVVTFPIPPDLPPGQWNVRVRTNAGGSAIIRSRLSVLTPAAGDGRVIGDGSAAGDGWAGDGRTAGVGIGIDDHDALRPR